MEKQSNPFCLKSRTIETPGPLCPWVETEHQNNYVPVDNTQNAYEGFVSRVGTGDFLRQGLAVLVYGEDGCGKTSLVHRCAFHLKINQQDKFGAVAAIADRSSEELSGLISLKKCEDTANGILQMLKHQPAFLPDELLKSLPEVTANSDHVTLRNTIEAVGKKLQAEKRNLIIIAPRIELATELQTYCSIFQRPGVAILFETSDVEVLRTAQKRANATITLEVGTLNADDGWRFVEARLGQNNPKNIGPKFVKECIDKYMEKRCQKSSVSIRELERVCLALYQEATNKSTAEIKYPDFADYYLRVASL